MNPTLHTPEPHLLQAMMEGQLRPHGVTEPALLARAAALARNTFAVGEGKDCGAAYADTPCALTPTRSLMPVRVVARMVQALGLTPESRVLVLAAGTGYEAAFLAPFVASVVACEDDAALQGTLRNNLRGMENATVLPNGVLMIPASSQPFTHVVLGAPFEELPPALVQKLPPVLKLAGVRVNKSGLSTALLLSRQGNVWLEEPLCECQAGPVHPALRETERFVF